MTSPNQHRRWLWITLAVVAVTLFGFAKSLHPFLAINRPVDADVMVVEGWVPKYVVSAAAENFKSGSYTDLFLSGLEDPDGSDAARSATQLVALGIDPSRIHACPAPPTNSNRTGQMAAAVRDCILAQPHSPKGINVVTLGPHGRQTLLAYTRMLGSAGPVGVITVPKDDYDPNRWWASKAGLKKTLKDFAGWGKELILGRRS